MKRLIICMAAVLTIASGCEKTEEPSYNPDTTLRRTGEVSLVASIENFETKATFNALGRALWDKDDKIAVSCTNGEFVELVLDGTGDTKRAIFKGTLPDGYELGDYAVYPADIVKDIEGDILTLNLASVASDTEPIGYRAPMVAAINDSWEIGFRQLTGLVNIKLTLLPGNARKIVVSASGKSIAGEYSLNLNDIESGLAVKDGARTIEYAISGASASADFYVPVPTGEFSDLSISICDENDAVVHTQKMNSNMYTVSRGGMLAFEAAYEGPVYYGEFVNVCGINWARGNLMYDSSISKDDFQPGWTLAKTQWYYIVYDAAVSIRTKDNPYDGSASRCDIGFPDGQYNHFNWGGIEDPFSNQNYSTLKEVGFSGKMYVDKGCTGETQDFAAAKYGDLAFWASKGKLRMPTSAELKKLKEEAVSEFVCLVIRDDVGNPVQVNGIDLKVWGIIFKDAVDGETPGTFTASEREITEEDLNTALFLPLAGRRANSSATTAINSRRQAGYWSATGSKVTDYADVEAYAQSLVIAYNSVKYGHTHGEAYTKAGGFCIRPVAN